MKRLAIIINLAAFMLVAVSILGWRYKGSSGSDEGPTSASPETITKGKMIFHGVCGSCHGEDGSGEGPLAANLKVKPRDFRGGIFKNRSTASGQLPTDADIYRTIASGIHSTAMPSFQNITPENRWAVVQYVKTFSQRFADPSEYPLKVIRAGTPIPFSLESIIRGRKQYIDMGCWRCHGATGEGDGPSAVSLVDDLGDPIVATNLTQSFKIKFASSIADIYRIFTTGLSGTPMPAYEEALSDSGRWDLANYVWSLHETDQFYDGATLEKLQSK